MGEKLAGRIGKNQDSTSERRVSSVAEEVVKQPSHPKVEIKTLQELKDQIKKEITFDIPTSAVIIPDNTFGKSFIKRLDEESIPLTIKGNILSVNEKQKDSLGRVEFKFQHFFSGEIKSYWFKPSQS